MVSLAPREKFQSHEELIEKQIARQPITAQTNIIHQVTPMLATSKNVLFPGHNHLLTTSTDDQTLWLLF